jgi:perosamine synthetase
LIKYPLARPILGESEYQAIAKVLESGHLVQGPQVRRFEEALAKLTGRKHAVACSSGTAALHIALSAMDLPSKGEVIVPAFGYPATANAVELVGLKTRFVDIDPVTLCPSISELEKVVSEDTVGFIPVQPFGLPTPIDAYARLAETHGFGILQDAACALGTDLRWGWADARFPTCLSFHPRKTITTGEGGMVLTDDSELARRMHQKRNHGIDPEGEGWCRFETAGFNYRLSDLAAALGVVQLGRLDAIVNQRRAQALWYAKSLKGASHAHWFDVFDQDGLSIQSMIIRVDDAFDRDVLIKELLKEGVQATLAGYSIAEQPYYRRKYGCEPDDFPHAARLFRQGLTLPLLHDMNEADVASICDILKRATEHARA